VHFQPLDPSKKWLDELPSILSSLHFAFPFEEKWLIPSGLTDLVKEEVAQLWNNGLQASPLFCQGRRLSIRKETEMIHPSLLPQIACNLLANFLFKGKPYIWPGGLVFEINGGLIGLFLHNAFNPKKLRQRVEEQRHGKPERLEDLDILIKGTSEQYTSALLEMVLGAISKVVEDFWGTIDWSVSALLPATVDHFFSIRYKELITPLPLLPHSPLSTSTWEAIRKEILDPSDPPLLPPSSFTWLHLACHEGESELVSQKHKEGHFLDPNEASLGMMSPIFLACQYGHVETLRTLFALGAELKIKASWKALSPLGIAKEEGHEEVVRFLEEIKTDPLAVRARLRSERNLPSISFPPLSPTCFFFFCDHAAIFDPFLSRSVGPETEILVVCDENGLQNTCKLASPFSLKEASTTFRSALQIKDYARMERHNLSTDDYSLVTSANELKESIFKIRMVPGPPWSLPKNKPWTTISSKLQTLTVIEDGQILDQEMASLAQILTQNLAPQKFMEVGNIKKLVAVDNPSLRKTFEASQRGSQTLFPTGASQQELKTWATVRSNAVGFSTSEDQRNQKLWYWDRLERYATEFEWNDDLAVGLSHSLPFFFFPSPHSTQILPTLLVFFVSLDPKPHRRAG